MTSRVQQQTATNAALIGMSCRLPGASTPAQLWRLLLDPAQAHQPGAAHGPINQELLRLVVAEALADASLPTRTLKSSPTGVYVCTHPGSYADPDLAASLSDFLGLAGQARTASEASAVALLHQAHYDLRVHAVDRAIVVALDERDDLTRAIALVFTATHRADHHRAYAHITGTWNTATPLQDGGHVQVISHALYQARCGFDRVWFWHSPTTDPLLPGSVVLASDQRGRRPQLCALPEALAAPGSVSGLVSVAATALALHHRGLPVPDGAVDGAVPPPFDPCEVHVAGSYDNSAPRLSATVLTSAPRLPLPAHHDPVSLPQMCPVSASSLTALTQAARARAETTPAAGNMAALADTALEHTDHHPLRAAVVSDNLGEAMQGFRSIEDGAPNHHVIGPRAVPAVPPRLVYVLTGLADVHPNAGTELMRLSEYAEAVEEGRAALAEHTNAPVWGPGERMTTVQHRHQATFLTQLALTAAWQARGLVPDAVVGCGAGEPAAAVVAGALSVRDAARVVVARSAALANLSAASVLLVYASRETVASLLAPVRERVHVALHLHAQAWCLAGPATDLTALAHTLQSRGDHARLLRGDAAHTPAAVGLGPRVRQALRGLRPRPADRAHLVTATPRPAGRPLLDAAYWASQVAAPAHLGAALGLATEAERPSLLVEVAARPTLSRAVLDTVAARHDVTALSCDPGQVAHALGELYTRGHTPQPAHSRANAHLVLPPVSDSGEGDAPLLGAPAPEHTQDHLLDLVSRIADADGTVTPARTWAGLELGEYDLVRLVCDLRQVTAWRDLTTADLDPYQPLAVWAKNLATRLEAA